MNAFSTAGAECYHINATVELCQSCFLPNKCSSCGDKIKYNQWMSTWETRLKQLDILEKTLKEEWELKTKKLDDLRESLEEGKQPVIWYRRFFR